MPNLHPLVRELRNVDLTSISSNDVASIFAAADEAGITPTEREILKSTFERNKQNWSSAVQSDWSSRLARSQNSRITSPPTPRRGPDSEDLSSRMKTVWMPGLGDEIQNAYIVDMVQLGAQLGFQLVLEAPEWASTYAIAAGLSSATGIPVSELDNIVDINRSSSFASVWGEDNKILTNGDDRTRPVKVLVPPDVSAAALDKAIIFTQDEGYHPYEPGFQGAVTERSEDDAAVSTANSLGRRAVRTKTYVEGGNLLPGVTSDGKAFAMVGRDSVIVSAFHLAEKNAFGRRAIERKKREMRAEGRLDPEVVAQTARKLSDVEYYASTGFNLSDGRQLVRKAQDFLATLELTQAQMAKDLDLPLDRLVTVSQPDFHIDMHMRPLAPGEILINHPSACIEAIDDALSQRGVRRWEARELRSMRSAAVRELREKGQVYEQIINEVEAAGLIAIKAPGVFESSNRKANFMNAVPGTTEGGTKYMLTNSSSIKPLEQAFERFAKSLGVDKVEFVGSAWGGANSLSASEYSLEYSGGLDCREVDHAGKRTPKRDLSSAVGIS